MALSTASWPAPPPEYEQPAGFEVGSYVAHSAVDDIGLNTVGTEPNSQQQFQFFLPTIATKIMDGLFVGSQEASHDMTFMQSNKITRIINCVGQSAPNLMARFGVKYLTFRWPENGGVIAFDNQGKRVNHIYRFIEAARSKGGSVLVHSYDGTSRACVVVISYLMKKFDWSLAKALAFVRYRRPECNPKPFLLRQLRKATRHLGIGTSRRDKSTDFLGSFLPEPGNHDEMLIRNTVLNSLSVNVRGSTVAMPDEVDIMYDDDAAGSYSWYPARFSIMPKERNMTASGGRVRTQRVAWPDLVASRPLSSSAPSRVSNGTARTKAIKPILKRVKATEATSPEQHNGITAGTSHVDSKDEADSWSTSNAKTDVVVSHARKSPASQAATSHTGSRTGSVKVAEDATAVPTVQSNGAQGQPSVGQLRLVAPGGTDAWKSTASPSSDEDLLFRRIRFPVSPVVTPRSESGAERPLHTGKEATVSTFGPGTQVSPKTATTSALVGSNTVANGDKPAAQGQAGSPIPSRRRRAPKGASSASSTRDAQPPLSQPHRRTAWSGSSQATASPSQISANHAAARNPPGDDDELTVQSVHRAGSPVPAPSDSGNRVRPARSLAEESRQRLRSLVTSSTPLALNPKPSIPRQGPSSRLAAHHQTVGDLLGHGNPYTTGLRLAGPTSPDQADSPIDENSNAGSRSSRVTRSTSSSSVASSTSTPPQQLSRWSLGGRKAVPVPVIGKGIAGPSSSSAMRVRRTRASSKQRGRSPRRERNHSRPGSGGRQRSSSVGGRKKTQKHSKGRRSPSAKDSALATSMWSSPYAKQRNRKDVRAAGGLPFSVSAVGKRLSHRASSSARFSSEDAAGASAGSQQTSQSASDIRSFYKRLAAGMSSGLSHSMPLTNSRSGPLRVSHNPRRSKSKNKPTPGGTKHRPRSAAGNGASNSGTGSARLRRGTVPTGVAPIQLQLGIGKMHLGRPTSAPKLSVRQTWR